MNIARYPFTLAAAEHVRSLKYSIDDLLDRRGFQPVRKRAIERLIGAIQGEIAPDYASPDVELLSYPLCRVMVSCMEDDLLVRRYAMAEAKLFSSRMSPATETAEVLEVASDLGMHPEPQDELFHLHFSQYISSAARMRSPSWRLVNRPMRRGFVNVTLAELIRLMEERVRDRVLKGLPIRDVAGPCSKLTELLEPVRSEHDAQKARSHVDLGRVQEEAFPPCIRAMLAQVSVGANLAHTARFALTSFMLRINMSADDVIGIFNTSPDFDIERTRYQVEHIAGSSGTSYRPPSCATMATYGNCPGEDDLCRRIRHPLAYYERRVRESQRKEGDG